MATRTVKCNPGPWPLAPAPGHTRCNSGSFLYFPLAGFLINGIFGRRFSKGLVNTVAIGSVVLAFAWVLKTILALGDLNTAYTEHYFTWIQSGFVNIGCDFAVDRLTVVMLLVVTGIGSLIHIYAIGYMAHEHGPNFGGYYRFFAYLNLFMFFMLTLVLAANFLLLFVGWEGVGLCSYLLIGFYFDKKFATNAGNKAFIVNRIGDFGFSLAMFLIFGDLRFRWISPPCSSRRRGRVEATLTTIGLLLLVGACGKSAQLPLYVWLPDAMAGPTPVSALIHAATMVTAGVYMCARSWPIYVHAPAAMDAIAHDRHRHRVLRRDHRPGAERYQESVRLLHRFAARLHVRGRGLRRVFGGHLPPDDARVLQGAAVPRLGQRDPRAFRRAGHAQHGRPAQRRSRGRSGRCCARALAIAGVPPFTSGFFSKDAILVAAHGYAPWMYWLGVVTAGMTAFYVFRAMFMTFFGNYRGHEHPHESPPVM